MPDYRVVHFQLKLRNGILSCYPRPFLVAKSRSTSEEDCKNTILDALRIPRDSVESTTMDIGEIVHVNVQRVL